MRDAGGHVKQSFTVRLAADKGTNAPGLYYLRLMKDYDAGLPVTVTTSAGDVRTVIDGVVTGENGQSEMSHGFTFSGSNTSANHGTYQNKYWRNDLGGELYAYDLSTNGQTEGVSLVVEYWAGDGQRFSDISIDGVNLVAQQINSFFNNFVTIEYPVDPALLEGRESVHVQFASADGKYSPGSYHAYLTTGRPALVRQRTPYTFMPENFEKNGSDGNISSVTYADGAIHIASGGGNYQMNMRMKPAKKNDYSILPQQFLFVIKGQNLSSNAYLWWLMGCNHGAQDAPTYTYADGSDRYLIWDLRKVATFNEAEKMSRFFGYGEVPVTTSNGGDYSLSCFGLTSSAADGSATISDIGFYSPEQLVDTYSVLKGTVPSLATTPISSREPLPSRS